MQRALAALELIRPLLLWSPVLFSWTSFRSSVDRAVPTVGTGCGRRACAAAPPSSDDPRTVRPATSPRQVSRQGACAGSGDGCRAFAQAGARDRCGRSSPIGGHPAGLTRPQRLLAARSSLCAQGPRCCGRPPASVENDASLPAPSQPARHASAPRGGPAATAALRQLKASSRSSCHPITHYSRPLPPGLACQPTRRARRPHAEDRASSRSARTPRPLPSQATCP